MPQKEPNYEKIDKRNPEINKILTLHPEFSEGIMAEIDNAKKLVLSIEKDKYDGAKKFMEERQ